MKLTQIMLAVLFWYGSQFVFAGEIAEPGAKVLNTISLKAENLSKESSANFEKAQLKDKNLSNVSKEKDSHLPKAKPKAQKSLAQPEGKFDSEIEKAKKTPVFEKGPGDYGGADDLKERLLRVRTMTAQFLKSISSLKDLDKLKDEKLISENTYQILITDLQTSDSNLKLKVGLGLRGYLLGMKPIFMDDNCLQEVADYPFSFKLKDNIGYMCVSRPILRSLLQQNELSDDQLAAFLIHEALHFAGLRDHITAQNVADELVAALADRRIPECRANLGPDSQWRNALGIEKVKKCHLVIPDGEFIVNFYNTPYGKGFSLNDDKYFMTQQTVKYSMYKDDSQVHIQTIDMSKVCPGNPDAQTLDDALQLLSNRQIYAKILFRYWAFNSNNAAVVGVGNSINSYLMQKLSLGYLNFSLKGAGVGFPDTYSSSPSGFVTAVVCLIPVPKSN